MIDTQEIIGALADEADQLLDGVSAKQDARPLIREYLDANHPDLDKTERAIVLAGLFEILEEEGFFEAPTGTDLVYDGGEEGG